MLFITILIYLHNINIVIIVNLIITIIYRYFLYFAGYRNYNRNYYYHLCYYLVQV